MYLTWNSLQETTTQLEQQLSRRAVSFRNQQHNQRITAQEISKKLLKGEAAVEFIRFDLYNKKWTDSTIYAALVLLPGDSNAHFIPMFEEKQLHRLLKPSLSAKLPDRGQVTMTSPFMRAYTSLCIQTCHKRNAPAVGGMAAQIPIKNDPEANAAAFGKVSEDKRREATDGHDGTWVAHPGLVAVAMEQFNEHMPSPNQIDRKREDVKVTAADLLEVPEGTITEQGLRMNCSVGVQYIASWLRGNGAAPINNLMEDAATAEISRSQVWQWIRHPQGKLSDGLDITEQLVTEVLQEEIGIN